MKIVWLHAAEGGGIATNRPTTGASVVTVDFEATAASAEW